MRISLFQQDIVWLSSQVNYDRIEQVLASHPDTDLLVLPEMCSTGFVTSPSATDLETPAAVEQQLLSLSNRYNTAICGSFAVALGGSEGNRNRAYFVTPEGDVYHYDKYHLFSIGGEAHGYRPGEGQVIVTWRGVRFMLTVCYDLRFPVWNRNTAAHPYDILICVANWPLQRRLAWDTLLAARAIENQAFVIGVNRVGTDIICQYDGGTRAIHPYGHILAQCPDNEESICTFEPDLQKLEEYRIKFPSFKDADPFQML